MARRVTESSNSEILPQVSDSIEQDELKAYISDMLLVISTGIEDEDFANIEKAAENIHAKSV